MQEPDETPKEDTPPEVLLQSRISRLDTVTRARREMVKVYRAVKLGEIPSAEGSRLVYMLTAIQKALEFELIEQRVDRLERAVQGRALTPPRLMLDG